MNIIYEFTVTENMFFIYVIIILLSILFAFFAGALLVTAFSFFKSKPKSKLLIILILFFAVGAIGVLRLDVGYASLAYRIQNQQYSKLCGKISIVSIEESYSRYEKEPSYFCTFKIGDETVSAAGYFHKDVIDKINENPQVEFYYINISGENTVCKIVEVSDGKTEK